MDASSPGPPSRPVRPRREAGLDPGQVTLTNLLVLYQDLLQRLFRSQVLTLGAVFLAIGLAFLFVFRSWRLAAIGLGTNLLATTTVLGAIGWLGIPLDFMTITIAAITMGIAVDDTIHLVSAFRDARNAGTAPRLALDGAIRRVAHPLILTTLAVGLGFALLGLSQFTFTRNLGLLIAGTMTVCLLADLALLPALLWGTDPGRRPGSSEAPN